MQPQAVVAMRTDIVQPTNGSTETSSLREVFVRMPAGGPFNRLAMLAAKAVGAPAVLVVVMEDEQQVCKGSFGLGAEFLAGGRTALHSRLVGELVSGTTSLVRRDGQ